MDGGKEVTTNAEIVLNKQVSENFVFSIDSGDTVFVLAQNKSFYDGKVGNLTSKIFIIKELKTIDLNVMSNILESMGVEKLNIFSIDSKLIGNTIDSISTTNGSIVYINIRPEQFRMLLNGSTSFLEHNRRNLYIFRGGNFLDIKNLFDTIDGYPVNLGIGRSQKGHALSSLDLRLSSYIMAMFNFDYKLISYLNTFNVMDKSRYLSYKDKPLIRFLNSNNCRSKDGT